MIGKICYTLTPFYDAVNQQNSFKSRPALIIANADSEDYVILPISKITHKNRIDLDYDISVDPAVYPKLNLKCVSYVRTHKQTVIHRSQIAKIIGDMKSEYEELYLNVLEKREIFSNKITEQAMS